MRRPTGEQLDSMEPNELTEFMVERRAAGDTFARIAAQTGNSPEECAHRVHDYLTTAYNASSVNEMRMLQVIRLEKIMGALWDQVQAGDLALEGRGATNLIAAIDKVTDLLDLKRDRLRDEQVILTRTQSQILMATLDQVRLDMLDQILDLLGKRDPEFRQILVHNWDGIFAAQTEKAIVENECAIAQIGGKAS